MGQELDRARGARLRVALKDRTREEFAAAVGVTPTTVYNWLRGEGVEQKRWPRIAEYLGVDELWLQHGDKAAHAVGEQRGKYTVQSMPEPVLAATVEHIVGLLRTLPPEVEIRVLTRLKEKRG